MCRSVRAAAAILFAFCRGVLCDERERGSAVPARSRLLAVPHLVSAGIAKRLLHVIALPSRALVEVACPSVVLQHPKHKVA
jgi:hypothetical protein